jgi:hypothetical protein
MTETGLGVVAGIALTVMGAMDFLRHQDGLSSTLSTTLLVVEIIAILAGVGALLSWARLRDRRKKL